MKILYLFLFFFIFNFISCDDVKETLEEYEGDNYEEELLKYKVNVYVENNFKNRKEITKDEFMKMFMKVITEKDNDDSLSAKELGKAILKKKGVPILIEKIHDYFNLMELTLLYDELAKERESDL
jgi:hypothetical protein